ncbi:hypothetical protein HYH03_010955 [Edaphochlamys debaryana]|uniref:Uncharacterized protein n=1 Tax=Edaphochlamys debaryana TaxID=47281 RepID=A0A835XUV5_9CHLO|nr:hypothetical protein HYH03_010955 [Edaphochlamys debaryana]|eukprot:KAG2490561.1 hypothetical protein HYH03_010955 [Edaphochlamys debaryana]
MPVLILSDDYLRAHHLHAGAGTTRPGTHLEHELAPCEDFSPLRIALKYSHALTKESVYRTTRHLLHTLGGALRSGRPVAVNLGVGVLRGGDGTLRFEFAPAFSPFQLAQAHNRAAAARGDSGAVGRPHAVPLPGDAQPRPQPLAGGTSRGPSSGGASWRDGGAGERSWEEEEDEGGCRSQQDSEADLDEAGRDARAAGQKHGSEASRAEERPVWGRRVPPRGPSRSRPTSPGPGQRPYSRPSSPGRHDYSRPHSPGAQAGPRLTSPGPTQRLYRPHPSEDGATAGPHQPQCVDLRWVYGRSGTGGGAVGGGGGASCGGARSYAGQSFGDSGFSSGDWGNGADGPDDAVQGQTIRLTTRQARPRPTSPLPPTAAAPGVIPTGRSRPGAPGQGSAEEPANARPTRPLSAPRLRMGKAEPAAQVASSAAASPTRPVQPRPPSGPVPERRPWGSRPGRPGSRPTSPGPGGASRSRPTSPGPSRPTSPRPVWGSRPRPTSPGPAAGQRSRPTSPGPADPSRSRPTSPRPAWGVRPRPTSPGPERRAQSRPTSPGPTAATRSRPTSPGPTNRRISASGLADGNPAQAKGAGSTGRPGSGTGRGAPPPRPSSAPRLRSTATEPGAKARCAPPGTGLRAVVACPVAEEPGAAAAAAAAAAVASGRGAEVAKAGGAGSRRPAPTAGLWSPDGSSLKSGRGATRGGAGTAPGAATGRTAARKVFSVPIDKGPAADPSSSTDQVAKDEPGRRQSGGPDDHRPARRQQAPAKTDGSGEGKERPYHPQQPWRNALDSADLADSMAADVDVGAEAPAAEDEGPQRFGTHAEVRRLRDCDRSPGQARDQGSRCTHPLLRTTVQLSTDASTHEPNRRYGRGAEPSTGDVEEDNLDWQRAVTMGAGPAAMEQATALAYAAAWAPEAPRDEACLGQACWDRRAPASTATDGPAWLRGSVGESSACLRASFEEALGVLAPRASLALYAEPSSSDADRSEPTQPPLNVVAQASDADTPVVSSARSSLAGAEPGATGRERQALGRSSISFSAALPRPRPPATSVSCSGLAAAAGIPRPPLARSRGPSSSETAAGQQPGPDSRGSSLGGGCCAEASAEEEGLWSSGLGGDSSRGSMSFSFDALQGLGPDELVVEAQDGPGPGVGPAVEGLGPVLLASTPAADCPGEGPEAACPEAQNAPDEGDAAPVLPTSGSAPQRGGAEHVEGPSPTCSPPAHATLPAAAAEAVEPQGLGAEQAAPTGSSPHKQEPQEAGQPAAGCGDSSSDSEEGEQEEGARRQARRPGRTRSDSSSGSESGEEAPTTTTHRAAPRPAHRGARLLLRSSSSGGSAAPRESRGRYSAEDSSDDGWDGASRRAPGRSLARSSSGSDSSGAGSPPPRQPPQPKPRPQAPSPAAPVVSQPLHPLPQSPLPAPAGRRALRRPTYSSGSESSGSEERRSAARGDIWELSSAGGLSSGGSGPRRSRAQRRRQAEQRRRSPGPIIREVDLPQPAWCPPAGGAQAPEGSPGRGGSHGEREEAVLSHERRSSAVSQEAGGAQEAAEDGPGTGPGEDSEQLQRTGAGEEAERHRCRLEKEEGQRCGFTTPGPSAVAPAPVGPSGAGADAAQRLLGGPAQGVGHWRQLLPTHRQPEEQATPQTRWQPEQRHEGRAQREAGLKQAAQQEDEEEERDEEDDGLGGEVGMEEGFDAGAEMDEDVAQLLADVRRAVGAVEAGWAAADALGGGGGATPPAGRAGLKAGAGPGPPRSTLAAGREREESNEEGERSSAEEEAEEGPHEHSWRLGSSQSRGALPPKRPSLQSGGREGRNPGGSGLGGQERGRASVLQASWARSSGGDSRLLSEESSVGGLRLLGGLRPGGAMGAGQRMAPVGRKYGSSSEDEEDEGNGRPRSRQQAGRRAAEEEAEQRKSDLSGVGARGAAEVKGLHTGGAGRRSESGDGWGLDTPAWLDQSAAPLMRRR